MINGVGIMCLVSFSKSPRYSALKKLDNQSLPAWAYIVLCDNCSHQCAWCYGGFHEPLHHHLAFDDFKTILAKVKAMGIRQVSLAGGEPTEHPEFKRFVEYTCQQGFIVHLVSHGEHIDNIMANYLAAQGVEQVQINWQGSRYQDSIHGVIGAHEKAVAAINHLLAAGVEVTTTTTVGRYNLPYIDEIMAEAAGLGVTRLRVWESTGRGNAWRKGKEAVEIFKACQRAADGLGYSHCLSYDPQFMGDVNVPCLQFSNMFMYISAQGQLEFCGAIPEKLGYVSFLDPAISADAIREIYLNRNEELLGENTPYCVARQGFKQQGIKAIEYFSGIGAGL